MTDLATTSLINVHPGAAHALELSSANSRRRGAVGLLLNVGGWLLFSIAWGSGRFMEMQWEAFVAIQVTYLLTGFLLSVLLGFLYDSLGVGPASFGRSLAIILVASYAAGMLWVASAHYFRLYGGASFVHSLLIGAPAPLPYGGTPVFTRQVWGTLPLLFGWSLLRLGLQYNSALREQREQALLATAEARDAQLRMLAYQLNPHFLFNTLNSIRALINEDRQRARGMVTALSEYLRYALLERPLHVALLQEEVESVRGYLAIEKVRFEERLETSLEIDPAALDCEVPAFLLNPLVENAVKHGAGGTRESPLRLRVAASIVEPNRLRLTVENTGGWGGYRSGSHSARDAALPGGVGLANVRARLAALHPGDHRIEIDEADGYVRVVLELPVRYRHNNRTA